MGQNKKRSARNDRGAAELTRGRRGNITRGLVIPAVVDRFTKAAPPRIGDCGRARTDLRWRSGHNLRVPGDSREMKGGSQ